MQHRTTTDYPALLGIARATVFEISSPSARSNLTDAIAAQAVEQYVEAVARGEDIHNPHGWVTVAARCRALDAMQKWAKEKKRNHRVDVDDWATQAYMVDASQRLIRHVHGAGDAFDGIATALWVSELINSTFPDSVNRDIATRCIVGGEKVGAVAEDLGMDAPAVSNRVSRIKARLKSEISVEDLRD